MLIKRILPSVLSFVFLAVSIVYVAGRADKVTQTSQTEQAVQAAQDAAEQPPEEMRGVWVAYMTLDVSGAADTKAAFQTKVDQIISDMKDARLNTMIVQVRPFCDALYPSRYFPWSHILTGTQGKDPGFDPLAYIIREAHRQDVRVHAWINPYRISTKDTPSGLSSNHPYRKNSRIGVEINDSLYLNPASDEAIGLIVNGVREIAENYDIDGVQFDDYFYPPDCGDFDAEDYESCRAEAAAPLSLEEFRKNNVNRMIAAVYQAIHQSKRNIRFGISPQGNLANNRELYADVTTWCAQQGYIDYICPQIYFSLDNPALTFENGLNDWLKLKKHKGLSLYIGIPAYKAGTDADGGTWLDNDDILTTEIKIARGKADGFMLYSYDSFHNDDNAAEIQNVIRYLTASSGSSPQDPR